MLYGYRRNHRGGEGRRGGGSHASMVKGKEKARRRTREKGVKGIKLSTNSIKVLRSMETYE